MRRRLLSEVAGEIKQRFYRAVIDRLVEDGDVILAEVPDVAHGQFIALWPFIRASVPYLLPSILAEILERLDTTPGVIPAIQHALHGDSADARTTDLRNDVQSELHGEVRGAGDCGDAPHSRPRRRRRPVRRRSLRPSLSLVARD